MRSSRAQSAPSSRPTGPRNLRRRFSATLLLAAALAGLAPARAGAADEAYRRSVDQALTIVRGADPGQPLVAAAQAAAALRQGTGSTQPEILADLDRRPPDLADARARLEALTSTLGEPQSEVDGGKAHADITRIWVEPRYGSLRSGPSLIQRVQELLLQLLLQLLMALLGRAGSGWGVLVAAFLGLAVLAFAAWLAWELMRRSRRESPVPARVSERRNPRDFFAEADRLAAAGELGLAVIALAGGVAAALDGDEAWEHSPLTVRELFRRAPASETLRPLLVAFEGASYGERPVDSRQYASAEAAAAGFRPAAE